MSETPAPPLLDDTTVQRLRGFGPLGILSIIIILLVPEGPNVYRTGALIGWKLRQERNSEVSVALLRS